VVIPADRSALLRGLPLFERVHPELLDLLAGTALERRVPPHQRLASKGESFPFLGIVFEGSVVALASSASGRQQLLYEATPCDSFGEISLLDEGSTLSQFAAGDRGATFMMVPKRALEIACGSEPALALRIARLAPRPSTDAATGRPRIRFDHDAHRADHPLVLSGPASGSDGGRGSVDRSAF
jgi:CRP-like cAMP-binding protein